MNEQILVIILVNALHLYNFNYIYKYMYIIVHNSQVTDLKLTKDPRLPGLHREKARPLRRALSRVAPSLAIQVPSLCLNKL